MTAGLSSASFCRIARAAAVLGLRLRRPTRSQQQLPMRLIVVARSRRASFAAPGPRPAPPDRPAPAGRPPAPRRSGPSWTGASPAATGSPPARPAPPRSVPPGSASSASDLAVRRQRLVGLARSLPAARRRPPGCGRRRPSPPRRPPARPPAPRGAASTGRCASSASSVRPTLSVSSASSKFACQQRPPRGQVRLLAQQGPELAVEVGGRLQQPVPQVLELLLLEQEVLADAGVERLDRLDGQVVPGLHRGPRASQFGVGVASASWPASRDQRPAARPWPASARPAPPPARPPRPPAPRPPPSPPSGCARPPQRAAGQRLAPGRDRLVGHPPLDVLGQRPAARRSDPPARVPSPSGRPPPAPGRSSGRAAAAAGTRPAARLQEHVADVVPSNGGRPVNRQ